MTDIREKAEALLRNEVDKKPPVVAESTEQEKSEGEKILALSHIRCKDEEFQLFAHIDQTEAREEIAILCIY